jgi:hypothetical protein
LEEEFSGALTQKKGFAEPWGSGEGDESLVTLEGEEGKPPI